MKVYTILCRAGKMDNYSYLICDEATGVSAIIDPSETAPIVAKCNELGIKPDYVLNTHHHFDHSDSNLDMKNLFGAKVVGNINDAKRVVGFDIGVEAGKYFMLGETKIEIIDASAHTIGHILFYVPKKKLLFTGDTLFNLCIGGIFEGTPAQMFEALQKIKALPDDVMFYPGHEYTAHGANEAYQYCRGNEDICAYLTKAKQKIESEEPVSPVSLGEEKKCNPYLMASSLSDFKNLF